MINGKVRPKPHIHMKNPLSRNISTRLRMYKVLLFKFRRHISKGSMVPPCLFYRESSGYRIVSTQGVLNVVGSHGGLS